MENQKSGEPFNRFADYIMGDDRSELATVKAERDYALHCLEREIAIAQEAQAELEKAQSQLVKSKQLLRELHATVWGECPSLLNEDAGGNAQLDCEIITLLTDEQGISK